MGFNSEIPIKKTTYTVTRSHRKNAYFHSEEISQVCPFNFAHFFV